MNEELIMNMVKPYIKENLLTYSDFEKIFSIVSLKYLYEIIDILAKKSIELVDDYDIEIELDSDFDDLLIEQDRTEDDEYDLDDLFKDCCEGEILNKEVNQSNNLLIMLIKEGNKQAEQDFCVKNLGLVRKYAYKYHKYWGNALELDDLLQVGLSGLIKAAHRYDFDNGAAFSTYATYWIKQSISRSIMDTGFMIRIPVHMMEKIIKVNSMYNKFYSEDLSMHEIFNKIAIELEFKIEDVEECFMLREQYIRYTSMDMPVGEDGDSVLQDFIIDNKNKEIEELIFDLALQKDIRSVIDTLDEREKDIIIKRFGFDDNSPMTLQEIGDEYGLSRERIRQIEQKVLKKIKIRSNKIKIQEYMEG